MAGVGQQLEAKKEWILGQYENRTTKDIADELGIKFNTLRHMIYVWTSRGEFEGKNGWKAAGRPSKSEQLEPFKDSILQMIDDGMSNHAIADIMSVSVPTLYEAFTRWGVATIRPSECDKKKDWIIEQYNAGVNMKLIAEAVPISRSGLQHHICKWAAEGDLVLRKRPYRASVTCKQLKARKR